MLNHVGKAGINVGILGPVYTMGQEVVLGHFESDDDWLINSFRDHFGLHQRKNGKVAMEVEVSNRHILRPN